MNKLWVYIARMTIFLLIWVIGFWLMDSSPPMQNLPWGILAWLLLDLVTRALGRYMHDGGRNNH